MIFLQGCKLRCQYCHNPDTWDVKGGETKSAEELMERLSEFKPFMSSSGGGVTLSGGEPMLQKRFIAHFFPRLKAEGYHTCVDTNGMVANDEVTRAVMEFTDLFLLDLKAIDRKHHRDVTGRDNDLPLAFLESLTIKAKPTWIRYVVVPGLSDQDELAESMAEHLEGREHIEGVELLPFHKMGDFKYESMKIDNPLVDTPSADRSLLDRLAVPFQERNLPVVY